MNHRDLFDNDTLLRITGRLRAAGCVYAEEEARLLAGHARSPDELAALAERRAAGAPLEYVLGWVEFCGLRIAVDPGVFVPRFRTEFMARQAAALTKPGDTVVDLCCGSGALGAVVAAARERIELHAADIDPAAVRCARRNLRAVNGRVYEGDLFEPLPQELRGRIQLLIANAPYVPTVAMELLPQEARLYEARTALDGGEDGLDIQRRIAASAPQWLAKDGYLLMETSERQAPLTAGLLNQFGLSPSVLRSEEHDATVVIGTR
ncbi:putative protein N(5)-glutamine methyltransferase [Gorillibacterium sp. sgz5001074]|uniref:putative protein N(5)-glutamine methyltransferase n=1 Tax=Gorillibacterium sp. sgz5001074 TaxID=3446695 RepID=UPI003F67F8C2